MQSDRWIEKGDFRMDIKSGILAQSKKCLFDRKRFPGPPHLSSPHKTHDHTLHQLRRWLGCYYAAVAVAAASAHSDSSRGTSWSPPASSAYRHPMAAVVRVIDDLFATPLLQLLLCSLWRLSTNFNATTATMKRMMASSAPNERFAHGKGATKTCA